MASDSDYAPFEPDNPHHSKLVDLIYEVLDDFTELSTPHLAQEVKNRLEGSKVKNWKDAKKGSKYSVFDDNLQGRWGYQSLRYTYIPKVMKYMDDKGMAEKREGLDGNSGGKDTHFWRLVEE